MIPHFISWLNSLLASSEIGGFSTRVSIFFTIIDLTSKRQELKKILQGLSGLKIAGADIVEVAPGSFSNHSRFHQRSLTNILRAYDTQDEWSFTAGAFYSSIVKFNRTRSLRSLQRTLGRFSWHLWLKLFSSPDPTPSHHG